MNSSPHESNGSDDRKSSFEKAVREYAGHSPLFRSLMKYKGGIAELRRKRASFNFITELLRENGVSVSPNTVRRFFHHIIKPEMKPSRRRLKSKSLESQANGSTAKEHAEGSENGIVATLTERREKITGPWTRRRKGPRIADSKNL